MRFSQHRPVERPLFTAWLDAGSQAKARRQPVSMLVGYVRHADEFVRARAMGNPVIVRRIPREVLEEVLRSNTSHAVAVAIDGNEVARQRLGIRHVIRGVPLVENFYADREHGATYVRRIAMTEEQFGEFARSMLHALDDLVHMFAVPATQGMPVEHSVSYDRRGFAVVKVSGYRVRTNVVVANQLERFIRRVCAMSEAGGAEIEYAWPRAVELDNRGTGLTDAIRQDP